MTEWPRYMQRSTAVRYCDMSETTFAENLRRGGLPPPLQMPTGMLLWDRNDIDECVEKFKRVATDNGVRNAREAEVRRSAT